MPAPKTDFNFGFDRQLRGVFPHRPLRTSDGDTPVIDQPVRMVSVDTPEKPGTQESRAQLNPSPTALGNASLTVITRRSA
jgi:endonuclease YncB( thermonuclease family)